MDNNRYALLDPTVINYLLCHQKLIADHFIIPDGDLPERHILRLSNKAIEAPAAASSRMCYSLPTIYVTSSTNCSICQRDLKIKNHQNLNLYDDVLGTIVLTVLTKYCSQCKLTYYNYKEKQRIFHEELTAHGVFFQRTVLLSV